MIILKLLEYFNEEKYLKFKVFPIVNITIINSTYENSTMLLYMGKNDSSNN